MYLTNSDDWNRKFALVHGNGVVMETSVFSKKRTKIEICGFGADILQVFIFTSLTEYICTHYIARGV